MTIKDRLANLAHADPSSFGIANATTFETYEKGTILGKVTRKDSSNRIAKGIFDFSQEVLSTDEKISQLDLKKAIGTIQKMVADCDREMKGEISLPGEKNADPRVTHLSRALQNLTEKVEKPHSSESVTNIESNIRLLIAKFKSIFPEEHTYTRVSDLLAEIDKTGPLSIWSTQKELKTRQGQLQRLIQLLDDYEFVKVGPGGWQWIVDCSHGSFKLSSDFLKKEEGTPPTLRSNKRYIPSAPPIPSTQSESPETQTVPTTPSVNLHRNVEKSPISDSDRAKNLSENIFLLKVRAELIFGSEMDRKTWIKDKTRSRMTVKGLLRSITNRYKYTNEPHWLKDKDLFKAEFAQMQYELQCLLTLFDTSSLIQENGNDILQKMNDGLAIIAFSELPKPSDSLPS